MPIPKPKRDPDFPTLSIHGGPSTFRLDLALDGKHLRTVTAFSVRGDASGGDRLVEISLQFWGYLDLDVAGLTKAEQLVAVDKLTGRVVPFMPVDAENPTRLTADV